MNHLYIAGTILFTVYGQLILKWRVSNFGSFPEDNWEKVLFLGRLLLDPFILSGLAAAFIASLFWMAVMTKFHLGYAYPFMSLAFVLVLVLSNLLFQETVTVPKMAGIALIVAGIIVGSQG